MDDETSELIPLTPPEHAFEALQALGLSVERHEQTLSITKAHHGKPYLQCFFVDLAQVAQRIADAGDQRGRDDRAFRSLQSDLFPERPALESVLYVVGTDQDVEQCCPRIRGCIELNEQTVQKRVVRASELALWLQSPFARSTTPANSAPQLKVLDRNPRPWEPPVKLLETTHLFDTFIGTEDRTQQACVERPNLESATAVYTRIYGLGRTLIATPEGLQAGFLGDSKGIPLPWASSSERLLARVAFFLAQAAREVAPGQVVTLGGVFNGLDLFVKLNLMEVLREFQLATGSHLQLSIVDSTTRRLATRRIGSTLPSGDVFQEY
jgi:hypothetical protein